MPSTFHRWLKNPRIWLGLLLLGLGLGGSAWLEHAGGLPQKFHTALAQWQIEPTLLNWAISGVLALPGVAVLLPALARRSVLLRPGCFIVHDDNPRHLLGREAEAGALAGVCAKNALAILIGESGVGKSALAKAGLLPGLNPNPEQHSQLLPVLIDASGLDWDGGLRMELAQALARWPKEWRRLLGDGEEPAAADGIFARLAGLPEQAPKRLLLVLDQIDDYLAAQREHFLDANGALATTANIESANPDWAALADLLRRGRVHVLLVCREDAAMLSALQFKAPGFFPLARLETSRISPLLDELTRPDGNGAVLGDPDAGWLRLKARLLEDLAEDGRILPVRLALALDALRGLRHLTLAEYSRHGGVRGLERLFVEKPLLEAKSALGYEPATVLRALALLAGEDGGGTRRASFADFAAALSVGEAAGEDPMALVDFLEQSRLLRSQWGQDGLYVRLRHDYLARGVREAWRRANRWAELLRVKSAAFEQALTWRQRWQALLTVREQAGLALAWRRGQLVYGAAHRTLAGWSLLRWGPLALVLAMALVARWQVDVMRQEQAVAALLNRLHPGPVAARDEVEAWRSLAGLVEYARLYAVRLALSAPGIKEKMRENAGLFPASKTAVLANAVLGFDPKGSLSVRIAHTFVMPCLDSPQDSGLTVICGQLGAGLHLPTGSPEAREIAAALVKHMQTEKDGGNLSDLGAALAGLVDKLGVGDVKPLAAALLERIAAETESLPLSVLTEALVRLNDRLDSGELKSAAAAVAGRMKSEQRPAELPALQRILTRLGGKLNGADAQPLVGVLLERMETETHVEDLAALGEAVAGLGGQLEKNDVEPAADELVRRMMTQTDAGGLEKLGKALAGLGDKLDRSEAEPAAAVLARHMAAAEAGRLDGLGQALTRLAGKLDSGDAKPLASMLLERMDGESDEQRFAELGKALAGLAGRLDGNDAQPLASAVAQRLSTATLPGKLATWGQVLASLGGTLDSGAVESALAALTQGMQTAMPNSSPGDLADLGRALAGLGGNVRGDEAQPLVAALLERMKTATDPAELAELRGTFADVFGKLDDGDAQRLAADLRGQMLAATNSASLSALGMALADASGQLQGGDAESAAARLVERMKTETDVQSLAKLAGALAGLGAKLDRFDMEPAAAALVERMKAATNLGEVSTLGKALVKLGGKLDQAQARPLAAALWQQMKTATDAQCLLELGKALAGFADTLDKRDVRPTVAMLVETVEVGTLADAWAGKLESDARTLDVAGSIAYAVELLRYPDMAGESRKALLRGLGTITGEDFHGDLWRFVDWAQSQKGRRLAPGLE